MNSKHVRLPDELLERWEAVSGIDPTDEIQVLLTLWATENLADSTKRRFSGLALGFGARVKASGFTSIVGLDPTACNSFLWSGTLRGKPPSTHTVHLRRSVLRNLYRLAHRFDPSVVDPTQYLMLPSKTTVPTRPLTDSEIGLLRSTATGWTTNQPKPQLVVALAETGATTGEIPQICWEHINFDTKTVVLAGATPIQPRLGKLTSWGETTLLRFYPQNPAVNTNTMVFSRPNTQTSGGTHSAQAQTANYLSMLLHASGLNTPGIRPGSIRLWAATKTLHTKGIVAATKTLGLTSLDAAARQLGYQWDTK